MKTTQQFVLGVGEAAGLKRASEAVGWRRVWSVARGFGVLAAGVVIVGMLAGCTESVGYPPVARIVVTPGAIPENDGFQTEVALDATTSADPVDDPEGKVALDYRWEIVGDEYRVVEGGLGEKVVKVTFLGEKPATVRLVVKDVDGAESSARTQVALTLRP